MPSPQHEEQQSVGLNNKRKGDELQSESAAKRRASRACLSCRGRKVRCDVTRQSLPCTNCRLDKLDCVLAETCRSKAPRTADTAPENSNAAEEFPVSLTFEGLEGNSRHGSTQVEGNVVVPMNKNVRAPGLSPAEVSPGSSGQNRQGLPLYVRPLPSHLTPIDIEYLASKGALKIPDEKLQCELFRLYYQFVHPFMPILDLSTFLLSVTRRDASSRVSLLLFQAVMFAGVAYLDTENCVVRGYESRRSMRKDFFERVRLLYDLDAEPDRIARLQALLLMTYWYERAEDEKDTWHWTGIALSLAQILGIHRDPEQLDISPKAKRGRKRIWWACYVRDRLLALGIRRPARIRPSSFNVPSLTVEDLEMGPLDESVVRFLGAPAIVDSATQKSLMLCFVELTQLCAHIGDILFTQYSVLNSDIFKAEDKVTMMVVPKKSAQQVQDMEKCDLKLRTWMQNLSPFCRYNGIRSRKEREQAPCHDILHLHQALMHMIYLTSTAILHRPQAQQSGDGSGENINTKLSAEKIADAAGGITEVVYDLHLGNLLRFASTSAIPALLSAILIHLNDISSARPDSRYASIGQFYQCWQALHCLRGMYASADHVVRFIGAVIKRTHVHIPMLDLTPGISSPRRPATTLGASYVNQCLSDTNVNRNPLDNGEQTVIYAPNALITPLTMGSMQNDSTQSDGVQGNSSSGLQMRSNSTQDPLSRSRMGGESVVVDAQFDPYTDFDNEINLLQALVHFDADPNYFPLTYAGPQEKEILPTRPPVGGNIGLPTALNMQF
ncbi:hypothetical protein F66182_10404 [Fusarium sp. NRRL 66182]|nr:hypothetical protein F66182_10404 [Fusarium sp. NRRL 66182]